MTSVPILHINQSDKFLSYRLENIRSEDPIWPQYSQPISDGLMNELKKHARQVLRSKARNGLHKDMEDLGLFLYDNLLPEGLRALLRDHDAPLYIWTELSEIPWEQLYDGETFWGLKYSIGRRIITPTSEQPRFNKELVKTPAVLIVASNPNKDLLWLENEVETVLSYISNVADVSVLSGTRATVIEVLRELRKGIYSVIHFCGHAVSNQMNQDGSALLLHDGALLTSSMIKSNLRGSPVVFLNACQSARGTPESESSALWNDVTSSLSDAFLMGGAVGSIGTVADVGDQEGAEFAKSFYKLLMEGLTLGEAIRQTRTNIYRKLPDTPVWTSFVLFGNPQGALGSTEVAFNQEASSEANTSSTDSLPLEIPGPHYESWQHVLAEVKSAVLFIETRHGGGTGFLVDEGRYAITCNHLVRHAKHVNIRYIDGRSVTASVLGTNEETDLAILKLNEVSVVNSMKIAEASNIQEGQTILAIGHPLGFSFTVTRGIVSNRCRLFKNTAYIQTDAALNPGNSGGPIINESGEVVGVVSFSVGGQTQGISFGVSPSHVKSLMTQFRLGSASI